MNISQRSIRPFMGFDDDGPFFMVRWTPIETDKFRFGIPVSEKFRITPYIHDIINGPKLNEEATKKAEDKANEYAKEVFEYFQLASTLD